MEMYIYELFAHAPEIRLKYIVPRYISPLLHAKNAVRAGLCFRAFSCDWTAETAERRKRCVQGCVDVIGQPIDFSRARDGIYAFPESKHINSRIKRFTSIVFQGQIVVLVWQPRVWIVETAA